MKKTGALKLFLGMALTSLLAACSVHPYSGQTYDIDDSWTTPVVKFSGFLTAPSIDIEFSAYRGSLFNTWGIIGKARSSRKLTYAAGQFCSNSPALYSYDADIKLPLSFSPYWELVSENRYMTKVKGRQVGGPNDGQAIFFTDRADSLSCLGSKVVGDCDFYNIAGECGFNLFEATIYAVN